MPLLLAVALLALGAGAAFAGQAGSVSVETAAVMSKRLEKTVTIPGDVSAFQAVNVHAKVAGFVESMDVDRGSWVKHGQRLGMLSAPELRAQRAEAEAKLQSLQAQQLEAEAKAFAAESTHSRLARAAETPGAVAGHDVEMAAKNLDGARAHVEALRSSVTAAGAALKAIMEVEGYLDLRAPFDGVVTERNVHPGSLVGPSGSPLLRVEQISKLRLTVPVPEAYVGAIARGMKVAFRVSAFPDQLFHGMIARPAHSLDVRTRTMLVELDVSNATLLLAPGMFAEVQWPISRTSPSLFVPTSSVVRTSERQFVVRVRDGLAEWVDVRRGETAAGLIEVFGDLREGDLVVRRANDELRPGTRIR
jgi:RND family efflux transporter MFP subunit